jgi:cell wall-associated NlpC family hydrolase
MRIKLLIPLAGVVAASALLIQGAGSAPVPPSQKKAIAAKKAEAQLVLNEIAAIDEQLNTISEQYDGARVRLQALRKKLAAEEVSLAKAKVRYQRAQERAAKLLVWMYTQSHGNSLDVILGARSLSELLRLSDAEHELSVQAATIATQAAAAKHNFQVAVHRLDRDRKAAAATVRELSDRRDEIMQGLAERRRLLASVENEVQKLEAEERLRQQRLAEIARARLRAELAAQARARAAAQARARAEAAAKAAAARRAALAAKQAKAKAAAAAATTTTPETTATPATTTTTTTTTTATTTTATTTTATTTTAAATTTTPTAAVPTTTTTTPAPLVPTAPSAIPTQTQPVIASAPPLPDYLLPPGHPEAAQIALSYLGVPYLWGGSTPSGFDCSGLVSYVYNQLGIALPHFAAAQWGFGVPVTVSQLQPGDLVFFDALDHVGIYLGNGLFVDAPHTGAFVRIDSLQEKWYAKKYVGARRL